MTEYTHYEIELYENNSRRIIDCYDNLTDAQLALVAYRTSDYAERYKCEYRIKESRVLDS